MPLRVILAPDESDAIGLKKRLATAVKQGRHLTIDAGAVVALATAGVQVLLAAAASAEARNLQFRLVAGGPAVSEAFGELGLADEIAPWTDPAADGSAGRVAET